MRTLSLLLLFLSTLSYSQKQLTAMEKVANLKLISPQFADSLDHSVRDKGFIPMSSLFSHPNTQHLSGKFEAIADWHYLKQNKVVLTRIKHTPTHYGRQQHLKRAEYEDFVTLLKKPRKPGRPEVTHYSESGFSSTTIDSLISKYKFVLGQLHDQEVISEFVKDSTSNSISKTHVYALSQLFDRLSEIQKFAENYHVKRERQLRFVHALEVANVLKVGTEKTVASMLTDYKFIELFHLVPHCNNIVEIDLGQLDQTPELYYPQILTKISEILPSYQPEKIEAKLVSKKTDFLGTPSEIHLSLRANKTSFSQVCAYHTHQHEDPAWKYSGRIDPSFVAIVNRFLETTGSDQRICFLQAPDPTTYSDFSKFAILCLTESQFLEWKKYESYFEHAQPRLIDPNWEPRLTKAKRDKLIEEFKSRSLVKSDDKKAIQKLSQNDFPRDGDFLLALNRISFEWPETSTTLSEYKKLTKKLSKLSGVKFTSIKGSDSKQPTWLTFSLEAKQHKCELEVPSDPDLVQILNEHLSNSDKHIYFFDSARGVAILTPAQEKFLFDYLEVDFE